MQITKKAHLWVVYNDYGHSVYQSHSHKDCERFVHDKKDEQFTTLHLKISASGRQINNLRR